MGEFTLTSPAFEHGGEVPRRHTCEGEDVSPQLVWHGVPEDARSLALIVSDPDAPSGEFIHWVGWGIDAGEEMLAEGQRAPAEGENGFGGRGYRGPCPPPDHGRHRYFFRLHALDAEPELEPGSPGQELERAIEGHVLGTAEHVGRYAR
jgi:Raf kinase inhibitor-like YbhB/YbcL family protein